MLQTGHARSRFLYARIYPNSLSPLVDLVHLKVLHIECRIVLPYHPNGSTSGMNDEYSVYQIWSDISKFPSLTELQTGHMLLLPSPSTTSLHILNNYDMFFNPFVLDLSYSNMIKRTMTDAEIRQNNHAMLGLLCHGKSKGLQVVRLPCYVTLDFWKMVSVSMVWLSEIYGR